MVLVGRIVRHHDMGRRRLVVVRRTDMRRLRDLRGFFS